MDDDPNAEGASERARKADERIYALVAIAEDQQTAVRAALGGLAQERAALATERVALVQQAERIERLADSLSGTIQQAIPEVTKAAGMAAAVSVHRALENTAATAIDAAGVAAKPTLDGLTNAVKSAATMQLELNQAVKDFRRKWRSSIATVLIVLIGAATLIMGGLVWLEMKPLTRLLDERAKLTAEVSVLQEQVDQARRARGRKPGK